MSSIGLIIASIVNLFLKSSIFFWIFAGIFIFVGLTAYDMQKNKIIK